MMVLASLGCVAPATASGQRGAPSGAADTAFLSAVVRSARADQGTLRMVVDPRPLRDVVEVTYTKRSFAGYDYVMKKEGARWEFVQAVPLFGLE